MTNDENQQPKPDETRPNPNPLRGAVLRELDRAKKDAEELRARADLEANRKKGDPKFVDAQTNLFLSEVCIGRAEAWEEVAKRLEAVLAS